MTGVLVRGAGRMGRPGGMPLWQWQSAGESRRAAELNPVPFGRCRGPWRERKHRTVPTTGKSAKLSFAPVRVWHSCRYNKPGGARAFLAALSCPTARAAGCAVRGLRAS